MKAKDNHVTIEHIFPQTPTEECWQNELLELSDKQKKFMVNSIGNLVPLSRAKNSKFQNRFFCENNMVYPYNHKKSKRYINFIILSKII